MVAIDPPPVPPVKVTVAPAPEAVAVTPVPTKLMNVTPEPTIDPSSLMMMPDEPPLTPLNPEPSPINLVAVTTPVTIIPPEDA